MFALTEFASVKNSFYELVARPNTIYKCIVSVVAEVAVVSCSSGIGCRLAVLAVVSYSRRLV